MQWVEPVHEYEWCDSSGLVADIQLVTSSKLEFARNTRGGRVTNVSLSSTTDVLGVFLTVQSTELRAEGTGAWVGLPHDRVVRLGLRYCHRSLSGMNIFLARFSQPSTFAESVFGSIKSRSAPQVAPNY